MRKVFESTPGIVDVDWWVEEAGPRLDLEVDREKAARAGVTPEAVVRTLRVALAGAEAGLLHDERAREPVPLVLRLDRAQRSSADGLMAVHVHGADGRMVPIRELVRPRPAARERFIYHKNLQPVSYVIAEVAGADESPVYGILDMQDRIEALTDPSGAPLTILSSHMPTDTAEYEPIDAIDKQALLPDFSLLIYPWRVLDDSTGELLPQIRLSERSSPTFIVHTRDDRSSSIGSVLIYAGLKKHNIPAELHIYENGGHGYGMRQRENSNIGTWPARATDWLVRRGLGHSE